MRKLNGNFVMCCWCLVWVHLAKCDTWQSLSGIELKVFPSLNITEPSFLLKQGDLDDSEGLVLGRHQPREPPYKPIYFPEEKNWDECLMNGDPRRPGTCKKFLECEKAKQNWKEFKQRPQRCYLDGFIVYVCCETENLKLVAATRRVANACEEKDPVETVREQIARELADGVIVPGIMGTRSAPGEFPYMASVGWRPSDPEDPNMIYLCGGVLFTHGFVLTAAHCRQVNGVPPVKVRLGGEPLDRIYFSRTFPIKRFISHPDYTDNGVYNDIAIIEFEGDSTFFRPACLWMDEIYPTSNVTAIGYGQTGFGAPVSNVLLKANLLLTPHTECSEYYARSEDLSRGLLDSQVCAADRIHRNDTCQNDSGGPMVFQRIELQNSDAVGDFVVGITSLGTPCGGGAPGIYTKVAHYIDWIEQIVESTAPS